MCATTVLCSAFLTALAGCTVCYRASPWHPLASYPGPWWAKTTNLWLICASMGGRRYLLLHRLHMKYGPFVRIGPNILSINSPSAIPLYMSAEKSDTYHRHLRNSGVELFLKPEVPKLHRERRRVWAGLFTSGSLSQLMSYVEHRTSQLMLSVEGRCCTNPRRRVDLREAFAHWAFDLMGDIVFGGCSRFELMREGDPRGLSRTSKIALALTDVFGPSIGIMDILWRLPSPSRANFMFISYKEALRATLKRKSQSRSLLFYLLQAGVSEDDMERDIFVAMQGGSDNVSVMLTLAVYFLLSQRQYYERLRKELDETFPDPTVPLPAEVLVTLPFLNGTINEALRLGTPLFVPRVAPTGGFLVDDRFIPEGTTFALAAYSQQISPDNFFPDPMGFHPERWIPGGMGPHTKADKGILASFTFGPYACIGKPLAYREMRHALARIILTFDMAFPHDFDATTFLSGMLNMHTTFFTTPLWVEVARRPHVPLGSLPEL
ncbi:cytochrome P450 [Trametes elegans]|nr:cytochrome P450 [Trametes elegans]